MSNTAQTYSEQIKGAWILGFVGFLSLLGFQAFLQHDPVQLFWFGFAGFFSFFRFRYEPMKYVGWLGVLGVVLGFLGIMGYITV